MQSLLAHARSIVAVVLLLCHFAGVAQGQGNISTAGVDPGSLEFGKYPTNRPDTAMPYIRSFKQEWYDPTRLVMPHADRSIVTQGRMSMGQLSWSSSIDPGKLEIGVPRQDFVDPGIMQVREIWQPNIDPEPLREDKLPFIIDDPSVLRPPPILKPKIMFESIIFDPGTSQSPPSVYEKFRAPEKLTAPQRRRALGW
ncbi:MAG: hypothetical protein KF708_13665 [Pirellulales bacterium]|nr:hypothetical protein [Pirellulales bacterium]